MKNAPNLKTWIEPIKRNALSIELDMLAGVDAWEYHTKATNAPETTKQMRLIELQDKGAMTKGLNPIILAGAELANLAGFTIAPAETKIARLWLTNSANTPDETRLALVKRLNECAPMLRGGAFYDVQTGAKLEEFSQYAESMKSAPMRPLIQLSEKPTAKELVRAFKQWFDKPLKVDVITQTVHFFNGIYWEAMPEFILERTMGDFLDQAEQEYSADKITRLVKLLSLRADVLPPCGSHITGFQNVALNKRTGELLPLSVDLYLRGIEPFALSQETQTPYFDDWLEFVSEGNSARQEAILSALYMILTNHALTFRDSGNGISRRRVIIPFTRKIPPEKKDVNFLDKVCAEVYGITKKLLARYDKPETARLTLERYQENNESLSAKANGNHLLEFAKAFTVTDERGMPWGSKGNRKKDHETIYKAYLFFADCQNLKPSNTLPLASFKQAFKSAMKEITGQDVKEISIGQNRLVTNVKLITSLDVWRDE